MAKRRFTKAEAAGNDFLFFKIQDGALSKEQIERLCDRHFGMGADGVVGMESVGAAATRWHFFNRDGSAAAMCGNAARAAAAWLADSGAPLPHRLLTEFGDVELSLRSGKYCARVPYKDRPLAAVKLGDATLVDTGVPHTVLEWSSTVLGERKHLLATVARYRWTEAAGAAGANVTFFHRSGAGHIEAVTFERGVEDFTLSCGTGVLAAAVVSSGALTQGWPRDGVRVVNPGAELKVTSADFPDSLDLTGPARVVFRAEWFE